MRIRLLPLTSVVAAAALALTAGGYVAAADTTADPYQVFMSPDGSDDNDGTSEENAVASLDGAQNVLREADPATDVEVLIDKGTYEAGPTVWQFMVADHSVSFQRLDSDDDERPVFTGNGESGYWLSVKPPEGESGGDTNLHFSGLKVEQYDHGGIQMRGNVKNSGGIWHPAGEGLNNNTITNMYFSQIGNKWAGSDPGYGAINLWNSSDNDIRNNIFKNIENQSPDGGMMHGVYLAHHSNANEIYDSSFELISGDPTRVRNDSNDNDIHDNSFERTSNIAQWSDWFCDADCGAQHDKPRECASHGNLFHNNENISAYDGGEADLWAYTVGDENTTGGEGCDNEGQDRLRTWDNT